ncbi:hypothetical protein CYY_008516 [Polysphondylium violaceum]|uniref:Mediator complex subunit 30 n=1 Tax=Polysphondylium violaceum TaxID=133409 RepID=A0A8J4PQA8_9MYCE|nr:hypothetical protein CYY_008516 [Polysphondylium violaceum]
MEVMNLEENVCALANKGEKSVRTLLYSVLQIVKQLKQLQSDPVLLHPYLQSTAPVSTLFSEEELNINGIQVSSNINNTSTTSFVNDNDRIKELNDKCITQITKLKSIINEIISLESKILLEDDNNNNNNNSYQNNLHNIDNNYNNIDDQYNINMSDNNIDNSNFGYRNSNSNDFNYNNNRFNETPEQIQNDLDRLKQEAFEKNCIIKKLIDNMRLLQFSINSMNRTTVNNE